MQFDLDIFRKNNINYSWDTIAVGFILGMVSTEGILQYALEYLEKNSECKLMSVVELACNFGSLDILDARDLLKQVFLDLNLKNLQKDDGRWYCEWRKWRSYLSNRNDR